MWVAIENAPFTENEREAIIAMGFTGADWGHPDVTLNNPVEYFGNLLADFEPEGERQPFHYADEPFKPI